jgi:diadenosine tetraphosphate (Ap4A) HIT family hydrolase
MFTLHEQLRADTVDITRLRLSRVLMMNDSSFPWLILVPQRENIRELYDLEEKDRAILIEEITLASRIIRHLYTPDKINVGFLGNLVPQLHAHVIGRFELDRAWPGPAWSAGPARPYGDDAREETRAKFENAFLNYLSSQCRC